MMEFTNFAEVDAIVMAAPTVVLALFALVTTSMNKLPRRVRAFAVGPIIGL